MNELFPFGSTLRAFGAVVLIGTSSCSAPGGPGGDSSASSGGAGNGAGEGEGDRLQIDTSQNDGKDAGCAAQTQKGEGTQVDLFIMLDQSGSMTSPAGGGSRWSEIRAAIKAFVADPQLAGVGVGIAFFPNPQEAGVSPFGNSPSCQVTSYDKAVVNIAPLPGNAQAISDALDAQRPDGVTPTFPALQGALSYATAWAKAHATHRVAVVLATDGLPMGCLNNTIVNAAQIAEKARRGLPAPSPPIPTYLIGVGPQLSDLNLIAQAGSQAPAFIIDDGSDAKTKFVEALRAIRGQIVDCEYEIPVPPTGKIDPDKVNVQYSLEKGKIERLKGVSGKSDCDPQTGGWYYDNPSQPTKVVLCDTSCGHARGSGKVEVGIVYGCRRNVW